MAKGFAVEMLDDSKKDENLWEKVTKVFATYDEADEELKRHEADDGGWPNCIFRVGRHK